MPIRHQKWRPWPLIGGAIFDFFSATAERNSRKLDRKQDLNVLCQGCVFRAHQKSKMAVMTADWLSNFRLLLWKRWTELHETWREARYQCHLHRLCFFFPGRSEILEGRPGLWLFETFSTFPLQPLNGIRRNLTGSKIARPFTKFVFFMPIGNPRWPQWLLTGWHFQLLLCNSRV